MTGFFMAWMMFLWIPSPSTKWDETKKIQMLLWMPVIGLMIGGLWYGMSLITIKFELGLIGSVLTAVLPWLVTGFMHIDGFMDCSDAVLSFKPLEKKLEILKDSHVGSFAVVSMVILGLLQACSGIQFIQNFSTHKYDLLVLIFVPALTRTISVSAIFNHEALHTSSYVGLTDGLKNGQKILPYLYIGFMFGMIYWLCSLNVLFAVLIGMLVQIIVTKYLIKNLGGMSGDISGSGIVTGELAYLMTLALFQYSYFK